MKNHAQIRITIGSIAGVIVCTGDIVLTLFWSHLARHYNPFSQTISYLGQAGSPLEKWIIIWSICFSILFALFGWGFWKAFATKGRLAALVALLLVIYGLGEGIGSGLFPINSFSKHLTFDNRLHNIFGGIADISLVSIPLLMLNIFPKSTNPWMYIASIVAFVGGIIMAILFLWSKYVAHPDMITIYKGLWQRLYILVYFVYLILIAFKMKASPQ